MPFFWWGRALDGRSPTSLAALIERRMLSAPVAGLLAAAVAGSLSLLVVADATGAGKTTLLTAALAHLSPEVRPIFLRGRWETFAEIGRAGSEPERLALLANEIGPALPEYLWGEGVGRFLAAARAGCVLYATAHAPDAASLAASLAGPPLCLPPDALSGFDLVASIAGPGGAGTVERIEACLAPRSGFLEVVPVSAGLDDLPGVIAGLESARTAGWPGRRVAPDLAAVQRAMGRLDGVFALGPPDARPGEMLRRREREASRGNAASP